MRSRSPRCRRRRRSAQTPAAITVTSTTLKANETIPKDHTADGKNVSPALMWSGAPAATKQFAMIMDDPDAQFGGQNFVHWVVYKIPGAAKGLPAELPMDATLTAPRRARRHDPGPVRLPPRRLSRSRAASGKAASLHLHGLRARTPSCRSPKASTARQLMKAMEGHIIGQGSLVSIYERVQQ